MDTGLMFGYRFDISLHDGHDVYTMGAFGVTMECIGCKICSAVGFWLAK
jgi:hypothetical protein